MNVQVNCKCGTALEVSLELSGTKIRCPNCSRKLIVAEPHPDDELGEFQSPYQQVDSAGILRPLLILVLIAVLPFVVWGVIKTDFVQSFLPQRHNAAPDDGVAQQSDVEPEEVIRPENDAPVPAPLVTKEEAERLKSSGFAVPGHETFALSELMDIIAPSFIQIQAKKPGGVSKGTGVFINDAGIVLTSGQLIADATQVTIISPYGNRALADGFFVSDSKRDLCVIKVDETRIPVLPIALGIEMPSPGTACAAFDALNPQAETESAKVEQVRSLNRFLTLISDPDFDRIVREQSLTKNLNLLELKFKAPLNSSVPIVNHQGHLVGMTCLNFNESTFATTTIDIQFVLDQATKSGLRSFGTEDTLEPAPEARPQVVQNDNAQNRKAPSLFEPDPEDEMEQPVEAFLGNENDEEGINPAGPENALVDNDNRMQIPPTPDSAPRAFQSQERLGPTRKPEHLITPEERKARFEIMAKLHAERDGTLSFEVADGKVGFVKGDQAGVVREFEDSDGAIVDLEISHDEKFLAAVTDQGTLMMFDFKSGILLYQIRTGLRIFRDVAFIESPFRLLTIRDLGPARPVNMLLPETGVYDGNQILYSGNDYEHAGLITASKDGRSVFASWSHPDYTEFWRLDPLGEGAEELKLEAAFGKGTTRVPTCASFARDDKLLITCFDDGWISTTTGTGIHLRNYGSKKIHKGFIHDMDVAHKSKYVATGGSDGQLCVTRWTGMANWKKIRIGEEGSQIRAVAYTKDDQFVAASRTDKTIQIYHVAENRLAHTMKLPSVCETLDFFGNDRFVLAGCSDGKIRIYSRPDFQ